MFGYGKKGTRALAVWLAFLLLLGSVANTAAPAAASGGSESVKVQMYNANLTDGISQLNPEIKLVNTGDSAVNLQDVKLRYYFTVDGEKAMTFNCWTSVGQANLTAQFIKMSSATAGADYYLEIGFTSGAGTLSPGGDVIINSWFNKNDWSSFTQSNDYSFNPASTNYEDWSKMTAYVSGSLRWGTEPAGASTLPYPSDLHGTSGEESIALAWNAVPGATAYDLEADGTAVTDLVYTTYTHSGLAIASSHTYRVKAKNANAASDWSPAVTVSTSEPTTLPGIENVTAAPAVTSVALSWNAVAGASRYDVEADGAIVAHPTTATYEHGGLLPDTEHSYRVRAVNSVATGPWSAAVTARTEPFTKLKVRTKTEIITSPTRMPMPTFLLMNAGNEPVDLGQTKLRYYFTVDNERPLSVDYWTSPISKSLVIAKLVKMPIPSASADYYLEIGFASAAGALQPGATVAVGTWFHKDNWWDFDQTNDYSFAGNREYADNRKATGYISGALEWGQEPALLDLPAFPSNMTAVPTDTSVALTWEAVTGATSYDVMADGLTVATVTGTTYTDGWLIPGTRHNYKIRTHAGDAVSGWSDPLSVRTTGGEELPAPRNVKAAKTENAITVTWNESEEAATGYDIEVDGTIVANGTSHAYTHSGLTPGSLHKYRVRAKNGAIMGTWSPLYPFNTLQTPTGTFDVNFNIDTSAGRAPISPYIYGSNDDLGGTVPFTSRRMGGNRMSTYNWENNASNAGNDLDFKSDDYVPWYFGGVPWNGNREEPGVGITGFHEKSLQTGAYTLTTLQTAGYAAKDKNGVLTESPPSSRWVKVEPAKGAPFSLVPDLNDNHVYMDELVNLLVNRFGNASTPTGIKGYAIDNEPGIWNETHPYMHPAKPGSAEVLNKGIALAKAVKHVDPYAEMFGPVSFGIDELLDMHASDDWASLKGTYYDWYTDYYLNQFRIASLQEGKRLLDVFDTHWYPLTVGDQKKIVDPSENDNLKANKVRLQAPRQLWDPSYKDRSWIGDFRDSYLPVLPRLQQSIDTFNPGTKIAITEYNYGGENTIYGGLAQTDVLGIYGKFGVYLATFWKMFNENIADVPFIKSAFNLFLNYDGNNSKFGDTKVKAETSDIENSSIYSSVYKDSDNRLHMIVINKNNDFDMNAMFNIAGGTEYASARVWAFDSNGAAITERQPIASITGNSFSYTIPKLTACHIVLEAAAN